MTRIVAALMGFFLIATTSATAAPGGLQTKDLKVGAGAEAVHNALVRVHYTGWLMDGTEFDSSLKSKPFSFTIDGGEVIPGWEMGVLGMKVGGSRELIIPPTLGYGKAGAGGVIPPNATLKFEVRLLAVTPPKYRNLSNAALKEMIAKGVPVVDIRTPGEWKQTGTIKGSHKVMAFDERGKFQEDFDAKLSKIASSNDEVILICRTGSRTAAIANYMYTARGYKKVMNVQNGITKWIAERNPVTQ